MDSDRALSCPQPWRAPDGTVHSSGVPDGKVATVEEEGGGGLLLPSRQARVAAGVVLVILGLVFGGLAAFLIVRGGMPTSLGGGVLGVLALLLLAAGVFALRRKPRTTGILLTPDHVVINWVHPAVRLAWDDITEIRPLGLRIGRANTGLSHNYVGVVSRQSDAANVRMRKVAARFGKDVTCALPMRSLDVDQLVVLHTLTFYLDNPDSRAELAGPDAVRRVREVRFRLPE
ncbi:hypothetical protein [Alloactinosynnema sp. L-07]|uniref:hypothetical protein n=1 Tax=Alloactinosynnema sp. L-07 TaxID=1653480 RepID=UPI00065F04F7|nr:hypothetical protein [Alloactinosynnema sp. L-07]CRK58986.1 hypothetical protein [Alloactinosynnema sp. L-07]